MPWAARWRTIVGPYPGALLNISRDGGRRCGPRRINISTLQMKHTLEATPNLSLLQGQVEALLVRGDRIEGCASTMATLSARAVVCSGTFLDGRVLRGEPAWRGARAILGARRAVAADRLEMAPKRTRPRG